MSEHDLRRLLALVEKHLGSEWVEVVEFLRKQNKLPNIEARIAKCDFSGAIADVTAAANSFAASIHKGYVRSGEAESKWLTSKGTKAKFDAKSAESREQAARTRREVRDAMTEDTHKAVKQIIADGVKRGVSPRDIARDIRDSIGLTASQDQHVRNYRRALQTGDYSNVVGRELHDDRANGKIKKAFDEGRALDPKYVDKLVENYRKKYIGYRAEVIARTESLRAVHEGTEEALRQSIEDGDVDSDQLIRTWHIGGGTRQAKSKGGKGGKGKVTVSRTRDSHRAMNNQKQPYGKPFVSGKGNILKYPGDPSAPISDTAQCRCAVSTEIEAKQKRDYREMSTATLESERRAYAASLSKDEHDRLAWYSGDNGYKAVNEALRHGQKPSDSERAAIVAIDVALAKYSAPHDVVLYRGVGGDKAQAMLERLKPGDTYTDKGYASTTVDPNAQFGGSRVIIEASKRATMAPIPSTAPNEYEVLLARGTTFRVLDVSRVGATDDYIGQLVVRVRVE